MKSGDNSAYPCDHTTRGGIGLTKRELFAAMAMQGFLANKAHSTHFLPEHDARYCIQIADALLAELEPRP